jgi:hypothetical protein
MPVLRRFGALASGRAGNLPALSVPQSDSQPPFPNSSSRQSARCRARGLVTTVMFHAEGQGLRFPSAVNRTSYPLSEPNRVQRVESHRQHCGGHISHSRPASEGRLDRLVSARARADSCGAHSPPPCKSPRCTNSAIPHPMKGGTAFPIWRNLSPMLPKNLKLSGKLCNLAASRIEIVRGWSGWICV